MTALDVTLRSTGSGYAIEGVTSTGARVAFDGDGGTAGATPMQHLLAATGACALMDVAEILRKKRLVFTDLRVECHGERPDKGHPKPFDAIGLTFRVAGDVPEKAFRDAVKLSIEKYCNVGATLRRPTPVAFDAIVDQATPAVAPV